MTKACRCIALILILVLLCGLIQTAGADVASLGIYFCGRKTAEDGTQQIVKLEGRFRVMQDGREAGEIDAQPVDPLMLEVDVELAASEPAVDGAAVLAEEAAYQEQIAEAMIQSQTGNLSAIHVTSDGNGIQVQSI